MKLILILTISLTLSSAYELGGIISGNRMAGAPLGRTLGDGEMDVEGICSSPGVACQNCTHAVSCIALPIGWLKVPLTECSGEETCNALLGGCSSKHVPECESASLKYKHICEQVGIFPDAYDCRKFHLCSPPDEYLTGMPADHRAALCPRHYAYNPHTAQCSIKLQHGQCTESPVPACKTIGQSDVLPGSPNHYYICLTKNREMYPQVFICPHGWFFWGGFCRPEERPASTTTTTSVLEQVVTAEAAVTSTKAMNKKESYSGGFFSTDKAVTNAPDTFLADKFDLSNIEMDDGSTQSFSYEINNSFETGFGIID